jgi:CBS domain-containing protein
MPHRKREDVLTPSLEHATVGDAMRPGIVSCSPEASAVKVARLMASHHVHCVFVMHAGHGDAQQPYVWGIISDLDLLEAALRPDPSETASSLAREPMITVKPETPMTEAVALMVKHRVTHLVVVESETLRPAGVVSTSDVADVFAWGEA